MNFLITKLQPFIGKDLINSVDQITTIAEPVGYSINVIDPVYNVGSIDNDSHRLNIRIDKESNITSFTIG